MKKTYFPVIYQVTGSAWGDSPELWGFLAASWTQTLPVPTAALLWGEIPRGGGTNRESHNIITWAHRSGRLNRGRWTARRRSQTVWGWYDGKLCGCHGKLCGCHGKLCGCHGKLCGCHGKLCGCHGKLYGCHGKLCGYQGKLCGYQGKLCGYQGELGGYHGKSKPVS